MAGVFLSYAHDDRARAERIATALEQAGHDVWWDRQIHAGRRFSQEIDEALNAAQWVVVLWSSHSVHSSWVQDEAAAGRDSGRLIPALLDDVVPPLGFRQYQSIKLGRVTARSGEAPIRPLVAALASSMPVAPAGVSASPGGLAPTQRPSSRLRPILLVVALAATVGGGLWWWWPGASSGDTVSVMAAAGADPALSTSLARQVVIDLGRFPGGQLSSLSFDTDTGAGPAAYRAVVAVQRDHDVAHVDLSLIVRHRPGIAWATTFDGRADRLSDLRQQAAAYFSAALTCATHYGAPAEQLSDEVFRSFLTGCVEVARSGGPLAAIATFRTITAKAPEFGAGWANLALLQVYNIADVADADRPAFIADMRSNLARAMQLAPDLEETLAADALVRRPDELNWSHSLPKLDQAIRRFPDSAILLILRATYLQGVGRMDEAVGSMRRALNAAPLTPDVRSKYILALGSSGQQPAAEAELAKAEAIWPESDNIRQMRYAFDLRYGDPRAALKMIETDQTGGSIAASQLKAWRNFIGARIAPSPATVDQALASFRERYRHDPTDIPGFAQALGTFGRNDEFFAVARNPVTLDSMQSSTEVLFRTHMKPILHDPRFIELANRLRLLSFWRSSGVWPDFCQDPDLPYECRAEASKYR